MLEWIIGLHPDTDGLFLDSFAGSGTLAHAVLEANKMDGGNRKFILVECEDYADTLTAERVRRVINGYAFTGTQREELFRRPLTLTNLRRSERLLDEVQSIVNLESHRFDEIKKVVKDGELIVSGEKRVEERTEGLGGTFTFCTLGSAIELDRLLTGQELPSFGTLGSVLFHIATNQPCDLFLMDADTGYLGESDAFYVWLIYKPDLEFLKSSDAALTLTKAEQLAAAKPPGKRHLVFAAAKFVSQRLLDERKLAVEHAPLPFALYRIERT